jgi:hypothetical protein
MDSGLAQAQTNPNVLKIRTIIEKLDNPEFAEIKKLLNDKSECQNIFIPLLVQSDLFLLLLDNPKTFLVLLTKGVRDGFLKQITESPQELISILTPGPILTPEPIPSETAVSEALSETQELPPDLYQQVTDAAEHLYNQAAAYTPTLEGMRDSFSGFASSLRAALPVCQGPGWSETSDSDDDLESQTVNPESKKNK